MHHFDNDVREREERWDEIAVTSVIIPASQVLKRRVMVDMYKPGLVEATILKDKGLV